MILTFEFSQRQEFVSVTLTSYCQLDLGIQSFSQMLAYFSVDGLTYHPQYVKVVNKEPLMSYKSQNITLSLSQRIGRFVKLELYFDNKWLLISEVNFRSTSTTKDLDFHVENQQPGSRDGFKKAEEILSDRPNEQSQTSKNTVLNGNGGKSNLKAKEKNQVRFYFFLAEMGVQMLITECLCL